MDSSEYSASVKRTWNSKLNKRDQLLNAAMGIGGEAGEVVDEIKKNTFHGKELNLNGIYNELGDVLYYIQAMLIVLGDGITFEYLMQLNSNKLKTRHPNGFDPSYHKKGK